MHSSRKGKYNLKRKTQLYRPLRPDFNPKLYLNEIACLRALEAGEADKEQQLKAVAFLRIVVMRQERMSFDPDPYVTAFNEGRRQPGHIWTWLVNEDPRSLAEGINPRDEDEKELPNS